jgi:hypothetical protein
VAEPSAVVWRRSRERCLGEEKQAEGERDAGETWLMLTRGLGRLCRRTTATQPWAYYGATTGYYRAVTVLVTTADYQAACSLSLSPLLLYRARYPTLRSSNPISRQDTPSCKAATDATDFRTNCTTSQDSRLKCMLQETLTMQCSPPIAMREHLEKPSELGPDVLASALEVFRRPAFQRYGNQHRIHERG